MTRNGAIGNLIHAIRWNDMPKKEALDMAIKALGQEPCEDAISREDALMALTGEWTDSTDELIHRFIRRIKTLPSVTSQPKTGHWLNVGDRTDWYDTVYRCSCCGREIIMPYELKNNLCSDYPYCHCGAKMVEPQESEVSE